MTNTRRVLITGISGFTGRHLARALLEAGDLVSGVVRAEPMPALTELAGSVDLITIDLMDREKTIAGVESIRPDIVFHLATTMGLAAAAVPLDGVRIADNVLTAAARLTPGRRVKAFVVGSAAEYGRARGGRRLTEDAPLAPVSPYGIAKMAEVALARKYWLAGTLDVYVARTFNLIGPGQSGRFVCGSVAQQIAAIERGKQEPVIRVGRLSAVRDFVDVRDAVRAYQAIVDRGTPGEIYNVCSGIGVSIEVAIARLIQLASTPVQVSTDLDRGDIADVTACVGSRAKIRSVVGWEPSITLDESLRDLLSYWRACYDADAGEAVTSVAAHVVTST